MTAGYWIWQHAAGKPVLLAALLMLLPACAMRPNNAGAGTGLGAEPTPETPLSAPVSAGSAAGETAEAQPAPALDLPRTAPSNADPLAPSGNDVSSNAQQTPNAGLSAGDEMRKANRLAAADDDLFFVNKLLHTSSAAKQIQASGQQDALDMYSKALAFFDQARSARAAGDKTAQAQALSQAKLTLFSALRRLPKEENLNAKQKLEFQRRKDTITALLEAQGRVRAEKGSGRQTPQTDHDILAQYNMAQQAYDKGDYNNAVALADKTLLALKQSLISLRNGDTLVRTLAFATPQDEYKYEIDRNDTHKMLVTILLKEKLDDPDTRKRVNENMEKAEHIRSQAERLAQQGDFETAIKTLEESTQHIVRAIRAAGVYIPG